MRTEFVQRSALVQTELTEGGGGHTHTHTCTHTPLPTHTHTSPPPTPPTHMHTTSPQSTKSTVRYPRARRTVNILARPCSIAKYY
jgi:hypothetical protein